jgi:hypothetical protein
MTCPVLGTAVAGGAAIQIDLQRLLVSRLLVQANSGAGKSWALRRILEQTHGQVPHVVIDVEGDFHTLREKFPYVLFGGAGADCKIEVKIAGLLARRVLEHGFSSILDISELKAHDRLRFVRLFLEALLDAPRALRRPLLVVVDEAQIFCPEKGQAESAAAVIDLMTRGRKRGYCGVIATTRISKLHKDAAAEANNKLIGRSALDLDMKRSGDELGFSGREQLLTLRDLDPGVFYVFGPAISKIVRQVRIGKVHTTHPEPGTRGQVTTPPAPEKMKAVLAKLADLPKEVEEQEGEIDRLLRENADLRHRARSLENAAGIHDPAVLDDARCKGKVEGYKAAIGDLVPFRDRLKTLRLALVEHVDGAIQDLANWEGRQAKAATTAAVVRGPMPATVSGDGGVTFKKAPPKGSMVSVTYNPSRPQHGIDVRLQVSAPQQRILDALAWLESVGIDQASRVQLAVLADQSPKSSGYTNNLGALRSAGLIDYPATGAVALTDGGRAAARAPDRPPTTDDLHRTLETKLPAPQWRILRALIETYPRDMTRHQLAEASDQSPSSSGYTNNLGALRSLGFIDYPGTGRVLAKPVLFLEGR